MNSLQQAAWYHDPERDEPVGVEVVDCGDGVTISVDPGLLRCYGLAQLTFAS